jgi:high-affinity nickel-transport protein
VIGGAICGSFVVFGGLAVLCYKPWRRHVEKAKKLRLQVLDVQNGNEASKLERREDTIHGRKDAASRVAVSSLGEI